MVDAGGISNTVIATGYDPNGNLATDNSDDGDKGASDTGEDATVTEIDENAMEVVKTAIIDDGGDDSIDKGDTIDYHTCYQYRKYLYRFCY